MKKLLCIVSLAAFASAANAGVWTEIPDAGDLLPGQITVGSGSLDQIDGAIDVTEFTDLYCIYINNPANFSATTVGGTTLDTQLFLFNSNGIGVSFNDDTSSSVFQSTITNQFVAVPGIYFLAVSTYDTDPTSAGGDIWLDGPFAVERAPDGTGAGAPLTSWINDPSSGFGDYSIFLTGATYHIPAPGAVSVLGLTAVVAAGRRRRA